MEWINHPGLAGIPATVESQELIDTSTHACNNICPGAGWELQAVQDGSYLISEIICTDRCKVGN